ncbi:aldehyde dehydrogenase family protein [candidate division KSB1 bacterium]|nr:aldehyde dehydrogenase family protein [candidate division KSB1 bacterium]
MSREYKMFINGKWEMGGERIEVRNPYNQEVIGTVPNASNKDVDRAIASAEKALAEISELPAHRRSKILEKTSDLLARHKDEIAGLIASESGKAWKYSVGEVARAVQTFKFAAEGAKQIHGETVPMDAAEGSENQVGFYMRFPVGVIAAISPFNFPLNLVAHKVAPAIAAGNSIVLKPATATPLTALRLGELLQEAGLPDGVLNIIVGPGSTVGDQLVSDERVSMVTFTGSPPVGKRILSRGGLKKFTMELGSNSATIVCDDADIGLAVERCAMGSYALSGQVCISVQRIYVQQSIADKFIDKFIAATQKQVIGDPLQKDCDVGPMIDLNEAERVEQWVNEAVEGGAKILTGGKREETIYQPTVLTNVTSDMKVIKDEVFGPVVSIVPFDTVAEAIRMTDDSRYGLQAGIFTQRIDSAFQAIRRINVGGVIINDVPTFRADHMPYGGNKESGFGREGLKFAIEEMTNPKMVCFNL